MCFYWISSKTSLFAFVKEKKLVGDHINTMEKEFAIDFHEARYKFAFVIEFSEIVLHRQME